MEKLGTVPKKYGVPINAITFDFMRNVIEIYENTVGKTSGTQRFTQQLMFEIDDIKEDLKTMHFCERRIGSSLNSESKLVFRWEKHDQDLFFIQFNPNLEYHYPPVENKVLDAKANKMKNDFESMINEFLINSGKGIEIVS